MPRIRGWLKQTHDLVPCSDPQTLAHQFLEVGERIDKNSKTNPAYAAGFRTAREIVGSIAHGLERCGMDDVTADIELVSQLRAVINELR